MAFLALSLLALGGMAMANVLIPSLVKRHYPDRIGPMTAVYTTALAVGLTSAFVLTVPIAQAFGSLARRARRRGRCSPSWRRCPGSRLARHDAPDPARSRRRTAPSRFGDVARTRLGLAMAASSGSSRCRRTRLRLVRDACGATPGSAPPRPACLVGLVAGDLDPAVGAGAPRWSPAAATSAGLLIGVMLLYPVGYVGLIVAPHSLAVLWALHPGRRADDVPDGAHPHRAAGRHPRGHRGAVQLHPVDRATCSPRSARSGSACCTTPVAAGPSRSLVLAALTLPMLAVGAYVARVQVVEDQL